MAYTQIKSCRLCLGTHDDEIHEATRRLHTWFRQEVEDQITPGSPVLRRSPPKEMTPTGVKVAPSGSDINTNARGKAAAADYSEAD